MCMPVYVSNNIFMKKGQSRMKCVEKYMPKFFGYAN